MKFLGYRRSNGNIGIRNHILIFPTIICASTVAQMISSKVPSTVCVTHHCGCGHIGEDAEQVIRTMVGFTSNPNVAGVLLVGLGCELITPDGIAGELAKAGQRAETISIQEAGGTTKCMEEGKRLAEKLLAEASTMKRESVDVSELILGTECGGSDALSGLTANPALGIASDLLVAEGGTVIISEIPEMLGAEHILAKRAADGEVEKHIWELTTATEASINAMGVDIRGAQPSPGNIEGGLTTIEEKSLGCIRKGGSSTIMEVLKYAKKPTKKGLVIMDSPGFDVSSDTGMIAGGAQVIVFTTGRGTPVGSPIAPVIKVSSNTTTYNKMRENIDINAGTILDGDDTVQSIGEQIFNEILEVASGKLTKAEVLGHREFAINTIGPRL